MQNTPAVWLLRPYYLTDQALLYCQQQAAAVRRQLQHTDGGWSLPVCQCHAAVLCVHTSLQPGEKRLPERLPHISKCKCRCCWPLVWHFCFQLLLFLVLVRFLQAREAGQPSASTRWIQGRITSTCCGTTTTPQGCMTQTACYCSLQCMMLYCCCSRYRGTAAGPDQAGWADS